jgi:1-pyrroline-5-carboxylate dehydrogenase
MGNTVVWKPATSSVYSAYFTYRLLEAAGLPPGVINMVPGHGPAIGDPVFASPHLAGLHFTGSTGTFQHMWRTIGQNIASYRTYPRIVGETGGKDFIIAHPSADSKAVATAIVRGAFEYQGQKCSAASRVYLPQSRWPAVKQEMLDQLSEIKMGPVEDYGNFVNAVIDAAAFKSITGYIDRAHQADGVEVLFGGSYSDEEGYYIEPTVLLVDDPRYQTMCEEIFGPVVTLYVYQDERFEETLTLVDETSPYALTGDNFAQDRRVIARAAERLIDAAGNFYINDKPTGAVVGQQPFGGARASGTNDKAGSPMNLLRWTSARALKETFNPPTHFSYPFLAPDTSVSEHAEAM